MVNKEFIVGSGGIIKDFQDRNIPQNSNNFVSVSVLIPTSEFDGLTTYGVCLASSKVVSGVETTLPSLICYRAKTIKIEGVDYIKYQCQLSIQYTNFIGQLKLTPYIIEIETINEGEEDEEVVITTQKTFTNTTLNVISSIASTSDASLEEAEAVNTLTALIEAKNIKLIEDYKTGTKAQAIVGCFTDYNATSYDGWLLIVKYSGGQMALLPYKNTLNNEFTEIDMDGKVYKLSNYSSGSYISTQLTYSKGEIDTILTSYYTKAETYSKAEADTLLSAKVDKTQKVNGKALSGDITLDKSDIGLGNVDNFNTLNSPTENANTSWVNAGGLWTYLKTNYADKSDYDTTKAKVEELYDSFKGTSDNDNVVNTLYDLIQVFSNFPESDNIASILNGLDTRLSDLEDLTNAVLTINGTITLDDANWVSNSGDYSTDYPYIITYQNDFLKGVENFDVIFAVDSDTSLLSTTATLNDTTGTITFYATAIPSADIEIEKIVAISNIGTINAISGEDVNQITQNKNDIADLKAGVFYKENTTTNGIYGINYQQNAIQIYAKATQQLRKSCSLFLYNFLFSLLFYTDESTPQSFNLQIGRVDNTNKVAQFKDFARIWRKINDVNYDIPYINDSTAIDDTKETYSRNKIDDLLSNLGGGSSTQIYKIRWVNDSGDSSKGGGNITLYIDDPNANITNGSDLRSWLYTNGYTQNNPYYLVDGLEYSSSNLNSVWLIYASETKVYIGSSLTTNMVTGHSFSDLLTASVLNIYKL